MNLLNSPWIPVRPITGGSGQKLTLKELLCTTGKWTLSLPRDDMEFAAFQLLVSIVQVLFPPADKNGLGKRIQNPMSEHEYLEGIAPYIDWFSVDHPDYPFMQVRGVKAKEPTPMDKLLAGLDTGTSSCFVNEPGLAAAVCGGCAAVAFYNQANNAPSFGGGFKFGLRGVCPASTLIHMCMPGYDDLRASVWFNILTSETLSSKLPELAVENHQQPTWVDPIKTGKIHAGDIGFFRGMFWQPAHVELCGPVSGGHCSLCGHVDDTLCTGFKKAKFNYTVDDVWPHPHSPQTLMIKKGSRDIRFFAFTTPAPSWTTLGRFLIEKDLTDKKGNSQGSRKPALIIEQAREYWRTERMVFIVGGYRSKQATILERRHDVFTLKEGWVDHVDQVSELVSIGLDFRKALDAALKTFCNGIKGKDRKTKGIGFDLYKIGESRFYGMSEDIMMRMFAEIDFAQPQAALRQLSETLKKICRNIFGELTEPYVHEPELLRTRAIARRVLEKRLREL